MLDAGADELYVGLAPKGLRQVSLDGRHQTVADFPAHFPNEESLGEVITLAKCRGASVTFMANAPFIPRSWEDAFIRHVETAVCLGVDSVTVSSIQTIRLLRKAGLSVPLVVGSALGPVNVGQVRLLKELGVFRITIPHCVRVEELKAWRDEGVEILVTGNFGTGSLPGMGRLWEAPTNREIGDGTRTAYRINLPDGRVADAVSFLDGATDCSLCSLETLVDAGVTGVKLIGREAPNPVVLAAVVDLFKQWIAWGTEGLTPAEKMERMEREHLMWTMKWVPRFCEKQRCTYLDTPTVRAYV